MFLEKNRNLSLKHHVQAGELRLLRSERGKHTSFLSYGAFELRLATEHVAVHCWLSSLGWKIEEQDLKTLEKFDRVLNAIFDGVGNQQNINQYFKFINIVTHAMKIDIPITVPDLNKLKSYWHQCSDLCHISWTFACGQEKVQAEAFKRLKQVHDALSVYANGVIAWPRITDLWFDSLKEGYMLGRIVEEDVLQELKRRGIWARIEPNDGSNPHFIGSAIPPNSD